ncbi:NERD domain-containing protein [Bacillus sp. FJAT-42376]|uniref:nuclease-related domain-containing protein n=1 Tax=Bacillus sp. FJAT-42376 TaxID=2014076 RepID=UPI000F4D2C2C|nr:nuclease-related domain-containing protein [Bacillus sp. FJAT-42376]AZB42790.1 NERD domain-containing protein [Bacillus sp. FJAT-42376]
MIVKERGTPIRILKLQALLRRLRKNHPKRKQIQEDLSKCIAGYRGEHSIDYYLQQLSGEKYSILHNIHIPFNQNSFQIDTLIITNQCIFILEVKNFSGTLIFDQTFKQLLRIWQGNEECFPDPILQVDRQKNSLLQFLRSKGILKWSVFPMVVISNPATAIKTNKEYPEAEKQVVHAGGILSKLKELELPLSRDEKSSSKKQVIDLLLNSHVEKDFDVMGYYKVSDLDIMCGVECSKCNTLTMERKRKAWVCTRCRNRAKEAHGLALMDYYLLKSNRITNRQFREFTGLISVSAASKLLINSSLRKEGVTKGRSYLIDSSHFKNEMKIKS